MKIKGVSSVVRGLATFGQKGKQLTANVVQSVALEMNKEAKSNAPVNMGKLKQSIINKVENDGLRVRVEVGVPYGAFIEFGTGVKVKVPMELQAEAMKFKGAKGGSFADFIESLIDWVKSKRLTGTYSVKTRKRTGNKRDRLKEDANVAFLIAMSILKKGIEPQPYLYPAWVKYRAELKPRLAAALNRLVQQASK
jgi:HK97 gp10 family phage protein